MRALAILVLGACSSPANHAEPLGSTSPPAPRPTTPAQPRSARRCLPVVAKECGCVYTCGIGEPVGDHWSVRHSFWKDSELKAKIENWCVGGECTEAFAAEIVCDGICRPKPADATCRFDSTGACVGKPEAK